MIKVRLEEGYPRIEDIFDNSTQPSIGATQAQTYDKSLKLVSTVQPIIDCYVSSAVANVRYFWVSPGCRSIHEAVHQEGREVSDSGRQQ